MEIIDAAWIAVFLLFSLALIFAWSKLFIIAGRVKRMKELFDSIENLGVRHPADTAK
jgi:hypothetical protein